MVQRSVPLQVSQSCPGDAITTSAFNMRKGQHNMAKYFQHIAPTTGAAFFWRNSHEERYSGVQLHINLNLLAAAVGDAPPPRVSLVPPVGYDTREPGVGVIDVQPLVQVRGAAQVELPIDRKSTR